MADRQKPGAGGAGLLTNDLNSASLITAEDNRRITSSQANPHHVHVGSDAWRNGLLKKYTGEPKANLANAMLTLREHPEMSGVLAFNEFSLETVLLYQPPWVLNGLDDFPSRSWTSNDDIVATEWLQRQGIGVSPLITAQAVDSVSRETTFHPVRDYLLGLQWDGEKRLHRWLHNHLSAPQSDYTTTVGRHLLMGAVARIFNPGCKLDTVVILEGPQGSGKSSAIQILFGEYFTDDVAEVGSKDAAMQIRGRWGVELPELDALSKSDAAKIKAFLSRRVDRFRPPYGSRVIESPRSCVFVGTTNSETYLKDETGGRRFLPIETGKINLESLEACRDQLWAEAVYEVIQQEGNWWIEDRAVSDAAREEQRSRYHSDPWESVVAAYVEQRSLVLLLDVMVEGLHLQLSNCNQGHQTRVARILRTLGFTRTQRRIGGKPSRVYVRTELEVSALPTQVRQL